MGTGILLIHGFTGSPDDFGDLAAILAEHGPVRSVRLPGHGGTEPPCFDREALLRAIAAAAREFTDLGHELIMIGHSTGGNLALAALREQSLAVRLMVLVGSPNRIDGSCLTRWKGHSHTGDRISFTSLAGMISLVNRTGSERCGGDFPVLLVQGEADALVPGTEVQLWERMLADRARTVMVPGAGHHIFQGEPAPFVRDLLSRTVADACHVPAPEEALALARLTEVEVEAAPFFTRPGGAGRHLAAAPAGMQLHGRAPELTELAGGDPLFINIEVTTKCDLRCAFCARTQHPVVERDMPVATFRRILDLLPSAYRVTLVGLGEPLQHPEIGRLVAEAASRGRRVALVTNGMGLTREKAQELLDAGLNAITFSLDAALPELAASVRSGSNLERILGHIRQFGEADAERRVSRAVFSAVSAQTLPHLDQLVRSAAELGVDALMLSDLNFAGNGPHTLWQTASREAVKTVRQAVTLAFSLGLPVLSVHGLEELGLSRRYHRHLLVRPSTLFERSPVRRHCFSPWQTLAVTVDGSVNACDCQPEKVVGNLLETPFSDIWQGAVMTGHRRRMLSDTPPSPCGVCPRF